MAETLREQQFTLARHLRDPAGNPPPPGLDDRRLQVYRDLFFGAIDGLLAGSFPVMREALGATRWKALVRAFYAEHRSRTPLFPEVAGEFVDYLQAHAEQSGVQPWLPELAHYEWVEQALFTLDAPTRSHDREGDLLAGVPLLSALALPLAYRWPVAEIGAGYDADVAPDEPTTLLVHRDHDHRVRFARITPFVYRLLVSLQDNAWTGRQHLNSLAAEANQDPSETQAHGLLLLQQLREQGVILGTALSEHETA